MTQRISTPPSPLLGLGNVKLGDFIHTFSLPAVLTCPGRSALCEKVCYALKGHMLLQQKRYLKKYEASLGDDFADRVTREVRHRSCQVVRVHVAGDFYSPEYVRKWVAIAEACPGTRFYAYTRSWRVPAVARELSLLAKLPNVRLWFSCDRDTGVPAEVPRRVRLAYLAADDADVPTGRTDLAFRVKRNTLVKRVGGAVVCPVENGAKGKGAKSVPGGTNCQKCGLCWEPIEDKDARRYALPVV